MSTSKSSNQEATIRDVANIAGVSTMSVTRVLRGEKVRAATKAKVDAAIAQTGYRPNPMVQSLMRAVRQRNVGYQANIAWLATPREPSNQFEVLRHDMIRNGAKSRAHELGFGFEEIELQSSVCRTNRFHDILKARGVFGAVIAPMPRPSTIENFPWEHYPVTTIGRTLITPLISHVMPHYPHMMRLTLEQVVKRGYQRVAFLDSGDSRRRSERMPTIIFADFNQRQPKRRQISPIVFDRMPDDKVAAWLKQHRPDVIIGAYPHFIKRAQSLGSGMLNEAGFATLSWRQDYARISGIEQPMHDLGYGAIDLVVAQIHRNEIGVPKLAKTMLIEGRWVEGHTLRPLQSSASIPK